MKYIALVFLALFHAFQIIVCAVVALPVINFLMLLWHFDNKHFIKFTKEDAALYINGKFSTNRKCYKTPLDTLLNRVSSIPNPMYSEDKSL